MALGLKRKPRSSKTTCYVDWMNYQCANPGCRSGCNVEGHHVHPVGKGGQDMYWNIVSLCWECHRKSKLHKNHKVRANELFLWKSLQELETVGFCVDDTEPDFRGRIYKALAKRAGR